ncbi:MAG: ATPase [Actinomycetia bacterium]|nr:ATPase [Actinomycetes bacterium]MCP4960720.1 ATPase [Actinomycetes bacterium]
MTRMTGMARLGANVTTHELGHLERVVAWWGLLADVSFADLLLFAPVRDNRFVVVGQIRPSTAQTLYRDDEVGRVFTEVERPLVARAFRLGEIVDGEVTLASGNGPRARVHCIPIRFEGNVIGVLSRELRPDFERVRLLGQLERSYLDIYERFAKMIEMGDFPFIDSGVDPEDLPRIGDGALVVDEQARIVFASPNAVSTLHRLGFAGVVEGRRLSDLGLDQRTVRDAISLTSPMATELDRGGVFIQLVAVPLTGGRNERGALVMMHDVTELRRRDRLLMSKDATIREIHHRVKNNLQTISSLLRIQGRRLESDEAKLAIEESVRRIAAISLVHETLAHETGEDISLLEIVRQLSRTIESSLIDVDRQIVITVAGDVGLAPAEVATPLAVVINELLQNVVDHAFPAGREAVEGVVGTVVVELYGSVRAGLSIRVHDDGVGLPPDFDPDRSSGLGTSIVKTLVTSELGGDLEMANKPDGGALVMLTVPPYRRE